MNLEHSTVVDEIHGSLRKLHSHEEVRCIQRLKHRECGKKDEENNLNHINNVINYNILSQKYT